MDKKVVVSIVLLVGLFLVGCPSEVILPPVQTTEQQVHVSSAEVTKGEVIIEGNVYDNGRQAKSADDSFQYVHLDLASASVIEELIRREILEVEVTVSSKQAGGFHFDGLVPVQPDGYFRLPLSGVGSGGYRIHAWTLVHHDTGNFYPYHGESEFTVSPGQTTKCLIPMSDEENGGKYLTEIRIAGCTFHAYKVKFPGIDDFFQDQDSDTIRIFAKLPFDFAGGTVNIRDENGNGESFELSFSYFDIAPAPNSPLDFQWPADGSLEIGLEFDNPTPAKLEITSQEDGTSIAKLSFGDQTLEDLFGVSSVRIALAVWHVDGEHVFATNPHEFSQTDWEVTIKASQIKRIYLYWVPTDARLEGDGLSVNSQQWLCTLDGQVQLPVPNTNGAWGDPLVE